MTTIAWAKGVIACDSQGTDRGLVVDGRDKVVRRDGKVYFIAGSLVVGHAFVRWIDDGQSDDCPLDDDTSVLEFNTRTGALVSWEGAAPLKIYDRLCAVGSGAHLAIGAMAAGATPAEAIRIACKYDIGSSGRVQVFESEKAKRRDSLTGKAEAS